MPITGKQINSLRDAYREVGEILRDLRFHIEKQTQLLNALEEEIKKGWGYKRGR